MAQLGQHRGIALLAQFTSSTPVLEDLLASRLRRSWFSDLNQYLALSDCGSTMAFD